VRFLHAADLHIDSPLGGLTAYEGAPVDEIRGATRRAAENLVRTALEQEVDLVVLAGDIFDGDWRDFGTGLFWVGQLARLHDAGIPVVMVAGNHDAASEISRHLTMPPNVTKLSEAKPETKVFDDIEVAVIGQGYAKRAVTADLAGSFPDADRALFTIGLLHTSLDGRPGHANYAPCDIEGLRAKGYQYWALGHVHQREQVCHDPWIVFPGNLQGRHAKELGPKGATVVTVEGSEVCEVEHVELDEVRWHLCEVDATAMVSVDDVLVALTDAFEATVERSGHRLAAVRVRVAGSSSAHAELWRDPHCVEAEIRSIAMRTGRVWVEKVKIETTRSASSSSIHEDETVAALAAKIAELKSDPVSLAAYEDLFSDLRKKLGAEARVSDGGAIEIRQIGTPEHLMSALDNSLELVAAMLAGEPS
jgi:DNA repair protein SbcD/Mre11